MKLVGIKVAGKALEASEYSVSEKKLTLCSPPSGDFELEIDVDIKPQARMLHAASCCTRSTTSSHRQ